MQVLVATPPSLLEFQVQCTDSQNPGCTIGLGEGANKVKEQSGSASPATTTSPEGRHRMKTGIRRNSVDTDALRRNHEVLQARQEKKAEMEIEVDRMKEERKQRKEHLRRQRDLILAKKNAERERKAKQEHAVDTFSGNNETKTIRVHRIAPIGNIANKVSSWFFVRPNQSS